ncbi:MAG: chromosome partitioning protein ParA [Bacteroidetes Order II. Incertae sedis bacterium]|jgi:hypothetical protein|nr:chromosome partitioning protein ParA [Bacteroidetes Order II. bacterium]MBT5249637.1 chromosome partitioning protein ParA [Bacteroidetes Order II. bacterium]MBT6200279.1 chromosome partitioning protein ParA [Bacteroidetes Order II. bacterium]MBT6424292.1 chromosome partitioning protein ParA [Bacteroidetes Order II. bacterium]MBT6597705.1 chromosome partitioning protein ParA [Bacteroidetes Order II. bacterium]
MSSNSTLLVEFIHRKLKATRLRLLQVSLFSGALLLIGSFSALWFISASLESFFWFAPTVRWGLLIFAGLGLLIVFSRFVLLPVLINAGLLSGAENETLAKKIGHSFPEVEDRLLNLLQLSEGSHSSSPEPFVDSALQKLGEPLKSVPFEEIVSWKETRKVGLWAISPVLLLLVFLLAAPGSFFSATTRLTSPATEFERPAPFSFAVLPGDAEIVIGEDLKVSISISGDYADTQPVLESLVDGEMRSRFINLTEDSTGLLSHLYRSIRQPFRYRVSGGGLASPWFTVEVVERPLVQELNLRISYPSYTRIPDQRLASNVGDVVALGGSRVDLTVSVAGARAERAVLAFESGINTEMELDGLSARASFTVRSNDRYKVRLYSAGDIQNLDPISYSIETLSDSSPTATLLSPAALVDLSDEMHVFLLTHITDDFGFRNMTLNYRLSDSRFGNVSETFTTYPLPAPDPFALDQEIPFDWYLNRETGLDPVPGDMFEYYIQVWDNDAVSGYKSAQTRVFQLRFPSLAEQFKDLDNSQDRTEDSIEKMLEKADAVREQFEELKEDLIQKPEAEWEDERALDQLQERQEEMENAVDEISQQMEDLAEQMNNNDLVSDETMSMFEELQEVVDEVRTPELMDALEQLESAIDNMDLNEMQDALEKFEFSEDMYSERLERTLDLFKQFRVQQDMDEVEQRAEDLAETEDKLAEETAKLENEQQEPEEAAGDNEDADERREELAEQQEMAAEEMQALEDKMEEVLERMEELKNMPSEQMQDLMEDTQDEQLSQKMQENAEEVKEGDLGEASQQQQEMSEQLGQLSSDMNQMQMNMQGAQMQLNIAAIRAAVEDILVLSDQQESLRLDVIQLSAESPLLRTSAQAQVNLAEGLSMVSDSLQSIAKEVPQMTRDIQQRAGDAMREMGDATLALTERAARRAGGHQKGAMTNLNELALMLSELLNQQMNGSGAGQSNMSMEEMMEQLQQMGQQQQQINQQIQQLLNDMQGSRLTSDMMERLRQLGSQQEKMRGDLRKMNREKGARNKVLGDLNRIADQMMESIEELQQNRVSRRTVQRQNQILTRLLEASRSLEKRGEEKKREGKTAEEILRQSPADLQPSEQMERLRRDLIRALETGYSSDYESLIRRYFEMLQTESRDQ